MSSKLVKSKRYSNLFKDTASGVFIFRKWSTVKRKQFNRSTGIRDNEARAYKSGLDAFNEWLGRVSDESGTVYFGRYAKKYLNQKLESPTLAKRSKRTFQDVVEASPYSRVQNPRPRLIDAFGHLPIQKISNEIWMRWVNEILKNHPNFKFFNSRKALVEILRHAVEEGHIAKVPKLENPDGEAAPPRALTRDEIRALFRACHYVVTNRGPNRTLAPVRRKDGLGVVRERNWIKLLMLIMWKQGARPGEILQYEWSMIHFDEGPTGQIHIPGRITKTRRSRIIALNSSVSRVLRFLKAHTPTSPFLFPSPSKPGVPIGQYQKTWEGVCRRAGLAAQLYWFRDTFITRKLEEGRNAIFIGMYCDSSSEMIRRKYAVLTDATMREVAE